MRPSNKKERGIKLSEQEIYFERKQEEIPRKVKEKPREVILQLAYCIGDNSNWCGMSGATGRIFWGKKVDLADHLVCLVPVRNPSRQLVDQSAIATTRLQQLKKSRPFFSLREENVVQEKKQYNDIIGD